MAVEIKVAYPLVKETMLTAQFMPHFFLSSQSLFPDIFHSMHISTRLFFNCFCMMKLNTEIQTFQKLSEKLQSKVFRNDAIKCRQFSFLFFEKFIYIVLLPGLTFRDFFDAIPSCSKI